MRIVVSNSEALVVDDFLTRAEFKAVYSYAKAEEYEFVHRMGWVKAWRLSDGVPLRGPVSLSHPTKADSVTRVYPTGAGIDVLIQKLIALEDRLVPWVGTRGVDWSYFFCRPYVYPANAGLSWHRDNQHNTTGAFTFYCHPEWNVQWGGELLVADASTKDFVFPETEQYDGGKRFLGTHFDNAPENERLMELGVGSYIFPKPNRLAVVSAGVMHAIKRVDAAAGNHARMSLQGTFMFPEKAGSRGERRRRAAK